MHAAVERLQLQVVFSLIARKASERRAIAQTHVHHGPAIIGTPRPSGTRCGRSIRHAGDGIDQRLVQLRATSVACRCWKDPGRLRRRGPQPCGTIRTGPFRKRSCSPAAHHRPGSHRYAEAFNEWTQVARDAIARPAKRTAAFRPCVPVRITSWICFTERLAQLAVVHQTPGHALFPWRAHRGSRNTGSHTVFGSADSCASQRKHRKQYEYEVELCAS